MHISNSIAIIITIQIKLLEQKVKKISRDSFWETTITFKKMHITFANKITKFNNVLILHEI